MDKFSQQTKLLHLFFAQWKSLKSQRNIQNYLVQQSKKMSENGLHFDRLNDALEHS